MHVADSTSFRDVDSCPYLSFHQDAGYGFDAHVVYAARTQCQIAGRLRGAAYHPIVAGTDCRGRAPGGAANPGSPSLRPAGPVALETRERVSPADVAHSPAGISCAIHCR